MRFLYCGDPHTQVSNLADSNKLMMFVEKTAREQQCDFIVLLGDQHHTHAVLRLEVQAFWHKWLTRLGQTCPVIALVGNHDKTGDHNSRLHAMSVFDSSPNVTIVHEMLDLGWIGFHSYEHDQELFVEQCNRLTAGGCKTIVCHQSFSGSKFENGYFDPHGINPDLLKADLIISGHIHMGQEFGKVWHPGTAMWLTSSDANQTKGIWVAEHDIVTGGIVKKEFFDTSKIVTPIVSFQWREGEKAPVIEDGARVTVELVGTSEWVAQNKGELKGKTSIKTTITDKAKSVSRNTGKNFLDFLENEFALVTGVNKEKFLNYLKELKLV